MTENSPVHLAESTDADVSKFHGDGLDAETVAEMICEMAEADARSSAAIGFGRRFFPGNAATKVAAQAYGQFTHAGRASHYPGLPSSRSMLRMQSDLENWALICLTRLTTQVSYSHPVAQKVSSWPFALAVSASPRKQEKYLK